MTSAASAASAAEPLKDDWLVRNADGAEFSTHYTEAEAAYWATKIGGTYAPHKPNRSTYWSTEHYDH